MVSTNFLILVWLVRRGWDPLDHASHWDYVVRHWNSQYICCDSELSRRWLQIRCERLGSCNCPTFLVWAFPLFCVSYMPDLLSRYSGIKCTPNLDMDGVILSLDFWHWGLGFRFPYSFIGYFSCLFIWSDIISMVRGLDNMGMEEWRMLRAIRFCQ